jgi:Zn-dependent protease with chaperone function
MMLLVALPLVMSVLLAVTAHVVTRWLSPAVGAWSLAVAAAVVSLSSLWSLSLLVAFLVDDIPDTPLLELIPVPDVLSVATIPILGWCGYRVFAALRRRRRLRAGLAAVVAPGDGELVVVREGRPDAFAVAGRPGRIVVTAAMLRALNAPQRRALLAHERAHLAGRHSLLLAVAQLAAAANPLLIPVRRAVGYLCERHADELAADATGDRALVAEALAAAAFAEGPARTVASPAFHRLGVAARVTALMSPPLRYRSAGLVTAALIAAIAFTAAADVTDRFYELVRHALPS